MNRNGVSMCKMIGLAAAAVVLMLVTGSRTASAQIIVLCQGPDCFYELSYYSNAHTAGAPDATLRLVNDGLKGDVSPAGDLCASIYVFDANEQLNECCGCRITPNGLLTLSVNNNLTKNPETGKLPTRGVIKVLSMAPLDPTAACDPTNPSLLAAGIHGWITHIQKAGATFPQTEEELTDATLPFPPAVAVPKAVASTGELLDLTEDCLVAMELGSGQGVCDCTDAGR